MLVFNFQGAFNKNNQKPFQSIYNHLQPQSSDAVTAAIWQARSRDCWGQAAPLMPTRHGHVPPAGHGSWGAGGHTFLQPHGGTGPPESPDSILPTGRQPMRMKLDVNERLFMLGLYQVHQLLGWPKCSFGVFHNILWKNLNELFCLPNSLTLLTTL